MKYLQQFVTTSLNVGGGIDDSQTTGIVLQSLNNIDATKPSVACVTWADPLDTSVAEWMTYTSINSTTNELQGVTRGGEGYSAKSHLNGAIVAFPLSKAHVNELNDALLVNHTAGGILKSGAQINDTSADHQYVLAVSELTADRTVTLPLLTAADEFAFQAHGLTSSANANYTYHGLARQAIINGGCVVAQRGDTALSTSVTYGKVDRFYGIAEGTVGAGNMGQEVNAGLDGNANYTIIHSGVTLTGAGKDKVGYRMEAKDAKMFKNQTASFSVKVYHNIGSAKTYTIYVNKANAADNFSAVTAIGNNGGTSVASSTTVTLTYENISLGDCSNGIEIIVECNCGEITGKNFYYTWFQFNKGAVALPFQPKSFEEELRACQRYCRGYTTTSGVIASGSTNAATTGNAFFPFGVEMRTVPTLTATASDWKFNLIGAALADVTTIGADATTTAAFGLASITCSGGGLTAGQPAGLFGDSGAARTLYWNAEL